MKLFRAASIFCMLALLIASVVASGASAKRVTVACKTTAPSATVAPWAKSYQLGKVSGNGKIYVLLPRWTAKPVDGMLHHKVPWLFSPTFKSAVPVTFMVYNAGGSKVGSMRSGSPVNLGSGGSGVVPTSLYVPSRGCYRVVAQAGATTYSAWIKVF